MLLGMGAVNIETVGDLMRHRTLLRVTCRSCGHTGLFDPRDMIQFFGAGRCLNRLPLVGAAPRPALHAITAPARLVARYGTDAPEVEALGPDLVVAGRPETVGELRFGVRHEGARTVADLLDRRTRIGLVTPDRERAVAVAEAVLAER